MDLTKLIPTKAQDNLCIGCVQKEASGEPPYGHVWWFGICGKCGEYRLVLDKKKLSPLQIQLTGSEQKL